MYLRAPLKDKVIYVDNGVVLAANIINISEGGLLVNNMPRYPMSSVVPFMIALPRVVEISQLSDEEILYAETITSGVDVVRASGRMVRGEDVVDELEMVFRCAGIEFVDLEQETVSAIENYVKITARNFAYALRSFNEEIGNGSNPDGINMVRKISALLGYNPNQKIAVLRNLISKDYLGLENL